MSRFDEDVTIFELYKEYRMEYIDSSVNTESIKKQALPQPI